MTHIIGILSVDDNVLALVAILGIQRNILHRFLLLRQKQPVWTIVHAECED